MKDKVLDLLCSLILGPINPGWSFVLDIVCMFFSLEKEGPWLSSHWNGIPDPMLAFVIVGNIAAAFSKASQFSHQNVGWLFKETLNIVQSS